MNTLPQYRIDKVQGIHRDIRPMTVPGMVVVMDTMSMAPCGYGWTEAEARAEARAYRAANERRVDGNDFFTADGPAYILILSDWATEYAKEHYKVRKIDGGRVAAVHDGEVEKEFDTIAELDAHISFYSSLARHWTKSAHYDNTHNF